MSEPALVLVHGGSHTAACWAPTVAALEDLSPGIKVLAVDLPGRGSTPADLSQVRVQDWVGSVVQQVESAGLTEVVIVGHSLAGLTVPGVVTALGTERVRGLVLVAGCVPAQSTSVLDTLPLLLRLAIQRQIRRGAAAPPLSPLLARMVFCNGMTRVQREAVLAQLVPDASGVSGELVDRTGLPAEVPRTWVLTRRDRALRPRQQRRFINNLGGVGSVVELDAPHDVMVSHPHQLAQVLLASRSVRR